MKLGDNEKQILAKKLSSDGAILRDMLDEHFRYKKDCKVFVEDKELPVTFDENKRRIDLLLKARLEENSSFEIYFVLEAKSLKRDFSTVVFVGDEFRGFEYDVNLMGADIDRTMERKIIKKMFKTDIELPVFSDFYIINPDDLSTDENPRRKGKIFNDMNYYHQGREELHLVQIFQNTQGYIDKLRRSNYFKTSITHVGDNIFIIPLIVTNTDLVSAKVDFKGVDFEKGAITPDKITVTDEKWCALKYTEIPNDYASDGFSARFEQQILVTNTKNVDELVGKIIDAIVVHEEMFNLVRKNLDKIKPTIGHNSVYKGKQFQDYLHMFRLKSEGIIKEDLRRLQNSTSYFLINEKLFDEKFNKLLNSDPGLLSLAIYLTVCFCKDSQINGISAKDLERNMGNGFYFLLDNMIDEILISNYFTDKEYLGNNAKRYL